MWISFDARRRREPPHLPAASRDHPQVSSVFERDLIGMGVSYIDLIKVFDGKGDPDRFFFADGHPNGMANDLVARALLSGWLR